MRAIVPVELPPMRIGGCGLCNGFTRPTASRNATCGEMCCAIGSVHARLMACRYSVTRRASIAKRHVQQVILPAGTTQRRRRTARTSQIWSSVAIPAAVAGWMTKRHEIDECAESQP